MTLKDREARLFLWLQKRKSSETPVSGEEEQGTSFGSSKRKREKDSEVDTSKKKRHNKKSEMGPVRPPLEKAKAAS